MNKEDALINALNKYSESIGRSVTIPLYEYEAMKDRIKKLNDEVSDLDSEMGFYRNTLQTFGLIGVSSKALVPGSVSYESVYNPVTYVTRYKVMFDIDTTKRDEEDEND